VTTATRTGVDTWVQAIALIDELLADAAQSKITIAALVREIATLRGQIGELHAQVATANGGVR
jgi:hypothetical protein